MKKPAFRRQRPRHLSPSRMREIKRTLGAYMAKRLKHREKIPEVASPATLEADKRQFVTACKNMGLKAREVVLYFQTVFSRKKSSQP